MLEDALQASYFISNNGLESAMSNLVGKALEELVRSGRAPAVSKAEKDSLVQTKAVADTVVQSILSNTEIIVPVAGTVENMVDKAVEEYCLRAMEKHQRQLLTMSQY